MKKFEFQLDPLIRLKCQYLDLEEVALARAREEEQHLLTQISSLLAALTAEQNALASMTATPGDLLQSYSAYLAATQEMAEALDAKLAACREEVEKHCQAALSLQREIKLLDKFREKRLAEWTRAFEQEIEQVAAESYLSRLVRGRDSGDSRPGAN